MRRWRQQLRRSPWTMTDTQPVLCSKVPRPGWDAHAASLDLQRSRLAKRLALISVLVVVAIWAISGQSSAAVTGHVFDYLHWTIAEGVSAILGWMGVHAATPHDLKSRRWFAYGLTVTFVAQLLFDMQEIAPWTKTYYLFDLLFLSIGPCFVIGMVAPVLRQPARQRRAFLFDIISLALVILTFTLDLYLPRRGALDPIALGILIAYPISTLSPVFIGAILVPTLRLRIEYRWLLLLIASSVNGIVWMVWNESYGLGEWQGASIINIAFSIAAVGLGYGSFVWHTERRTDAIWERRCEAILRLVPLFIVAAGVFGLAALWVLPNVITSVRITTVAGTAIVMLLTTLRQSMSLQEYDRLIAAERRLYDRTRELEASNGRLKAATLEAEVSSRTAQSANQAKKASFWPT